MPRWGFCSMFFRFSVFLEILCKRYNTSSNFRALEGEKTRAFFLTCFFCVFCKLANGPIHPPIRPPLLHQIFTKTLLLAPSCDYWKPSFPEGLKMTQKVSKRVPKGAPRLDFFLEMTQKVSPRVPKGAPRWDFFIQPMCCCRGGSGLGCFVCGCCSFLLFRVSVCCFSCYFYCCLLSAWARRTARSG